MFSQGLEVLVLPSLSKGSQQRADPSTLPQKADSSACRPKIEEQDKTILESTEHLNNAECL